MNPLNPIFALTVFSLAFGTAYLLNSKYKIVINNNRYETIDGIRGFLAISVFIHHATIWFHYLHTNSWEAPKSNLYNQLGQTSVSLFFMITSFLFVSKLLNEGTQTTNWKDFFIGRIFRLVPLYLVSIILLIFIVMICTHWKLNVSIIDFLKQLTHWGTFTMYDAPKINHCEFTNIINASVIWSLPYEWLFYFSLPLLYIIINRKKTSISFSIISLLFIVVFYRFHGILKPHIMSFIGGAIAPFLIKYKPKKINFNSVFLSITLLLSLGLILRYNSSDNILCKMFIIIAFNLIALGNNLFGLLKNTTLKFLGELSYSTYLLHGILIFCVMYFCVGLTDAKTLTATNYCLILIGITPLVVIISFLTYLFIEKPGMNYGKKLRIKNNTSNI